MRTDNNSTHFETVHRSFDFSMRAGNLSVSLSPAPELFTLSMTPFGSPSLSEAYPCQNDVG